MSGSKIINVSVRDVRFPTSLEQHGSDAMVCFLWFLYYAPTTMNALLL